MLFFLKQTDGFLVLWGEWGQPEHAEAFTKVNANSVGL